MFSSLISNQFREFYGRVQRVAEFHGWFWSFGPSLHYDLPTPAGSIQDVLEGFGRIPVPATYEARNVPAATVAGCVLRDCIYCGAHAMFVFMLRQVGVFQVVRRLAVGISEQGRTPAGHRRYAVRRPAHLSIAGLVIGYPEKRSRTA